MWRPPRGYPQVGAAPTPDRRGGAAGEVARRVSPPVVGRPWTALGASVAKDEKEFIRLAEEGQFATQKGHSTGA